MVRRDDKRAQKKLIISSGKARPIDGKKQDPKDVNGGYLRPKVLDFQPKQN